MQTPTGINLQLNNSLEQHRHVLSLPTQPLITQFNSFATILSAYIHFTQNAGIAYFDLPIDTESYPYKPTRFLAISEDVSMKSMHVERQGNGSRRDGSEFVIFHSLSLFEGLTCIVEKKVATITVSSIPDGSNDVATLLQAPLVNLSVDFTDQREARHLDALSKLLHSTGIATMLGFTDNEIVFKN